MPPFAKSRAIQFTGCAVVLCVPIALAIHGLSSEAAEPAGRKSESTKSQFMQRKLTTVHKVVEGLATEDFDLVRDGADEWLTLAESATWNVPRDPVYMHYSRDFENVVRRMRDAAERESLQEATFAYVHVTVSCMACHEHVRGVVRVAPHAVENDRSRTRRR